MDNPEEWQDPRDLVRLRIVQGRGREAVAALQARLDQGRGGNLTRIALSQGLMALGDAPAAIAAAREAAHLAPDSVEAIMTLGQALAANADLTGAIGEYQRAARQAPDDPDPQLAAAGLWAEIGEWDKALEVLGRAEALGADGAPLRAQIAQAQTAPRLPANFVRHLFDQFSADYDQRMLQKLGYAAPAILRDVAAMYWGPKPAPRPMLDLGCGTGLSGRALADVAQTLTGIDLSPKMLDVARQTGVYAQLIEADIESWLATAQPDQFAAVVAADVLGYLGDLSLIFQGVARVLRTDGIWLFTVETSPSADYAIGTRRRYQHSEAYVRSLAAASGFDVASLIHATLRYDAGQAVDGMAGLFVRR